MKDHALGPILHSFFADHLVALRGLRPASIRSYRDVVRLLVLFAASEKRCKITQLCVEDLTFDCICRFMRHLEEKRGNHVRTRNQRLAVIHGLFEYLAGRMPELLATCQRVAAIPVKRAPPPETRFLEREETTALFRALPGDGRNAVRDRTLLTFLYNTGARVQEVADLRAKDLDLGPHPRVRLHGKGDKWRSCPLWDDTASRLRLWLDQRGIVANSDSAVFTGRDRRPLTRFGIYKIVRRHARVLDGHSPSKPSRHVSPHVFRHTAAMHLLEAGVEVNVIRGWLGHADLSTTNRYAEISTRAKEEALRACETVPETSAEFPRKPVWRTDAALLEWLASL